MRNIARTILVSVMFIALLYSALAHSQETTNLTETVTVPDTATDAVVAPKLSVFHMLIPFLTTALIAAVKWGVPKIPAKLFPIITPILGMALDLCNYFATGADLNPTLAAGLGLAGVGIREAYDQLKKPAAVTP